MGEYMINKKNQSIIIFKKCISPSKCRIGGIKVCLFSLGNCKIAEIIKNESHNRYLINKTPFTLLTLLPILEISGIYVSFQFVSQLKQMQLDASNLVIFTIGSL